MAVKETRKRLAFRVRGFINFLKTLSRNGKARTGLIIIVAFLIIAFFPFLFTPYSPLGQDSRTLKAVGPKYAVPEWFRAVPAFLGGNPDLSGNLHPIESPGLPNLVENGGEFTFKTNTSEISAELDINVGYPFDVNIPSLVTEDGSQAITFNRESGRIANETKAYFSKTFEYPYGSPPAQFGGNLDLLVEGSTHWVDSVKYLDVPLKINVFLEAVGKTRWNIWPSPYNITGGYITARSAIIAGLQGFEHNITGEVFISRPESGLEDGWIISRTSREGATSNINSEGYISRVAMDIPVNVNPIPYIFIDTPGNYTYGIEVTFLDTGYVNKTVGTTIYVDNFNLYLWGDAQGLMGLDQEGRDLFAQVVYGTRISLYLGIAVSVMTIGLGLLVGLAAGYIGSFVDQGLMRFNDLMLCLPTLPLLIVLAAVLGTTIENLMLILVLLGWNGFARVVRSLTLSLKERPFVEAAKAVGAGTGYTIFKHILPNVMSVVYVSLATSVPGAVTAEASLSWLGFFDPTRMSWGRMLHNATAEGGTALAIANPTWIIVPGLMISALAVSFILLGYALDEILNPRLRMRR